jgi:hypothetical protein
MTDSSSFLLNRFHLQYTIVVVENGDSFTMTAVTAVTLLGSSFLDVFILIQLQSKLFIFAILDQRTHFRNNCASSKLFTGFEQ